MTTYNFQDYALHKRRQICVVGIINSPRWKAFQQNSDFWLSQLPLAESPGVLNSAARNRKYKWKCSLIHYIASPRQNISRKESFKGNLHDKVSFSLYLKDKAIWTVMPSFPGIVFISISNLILKRPAWTQASKNHIVLYAYSPVGRGKR